MWSSGKEDWRAHAQSLSRVRLSAIQTQGSCISYIAGFFTAEPPGKPEDWHICLQWPSA